MNSDAPATDAEILQFFRRFDSNDDGRIDEREFRKVLSELGEEPLDEVLSLQFALIDENHDGLVDFRELLDWWRDYR